LLSGRIWKQEESNYQPENLADTYLIMYITYDWAKLSSGFVFSFLTAGQSG
jgi:hypothetical protein